MKSFCAVTSYHLLKCFVKTLKKFMGFACDCFACEAWAAFRAATSDVTSFKNKFYLHKWGYTD